MGAALVAFVAVIAYVPTVANDWVRWDDPETFLNNPNYRGLGLAQLRWMATTFHMGHYIPVTWLTLGLDYVLWGMNAAGYHVTSFVIHAAAAVALYYLARRILAFFTTDAAALTTGAAGAALFFAVHPLRVESVAWVTERRDVLSGLLAVVSVIAYLRSVRDGDAGRRWSRWYWASLVLFAVALLSKSITVSLPVALVLLDIHPLRRLPGDPRQWLTRAARRVWIEKVPFFALAAAGAVLAILANRAIGNLSPVSGITIPARLALTVHSIAFYIVKTLVPAALSPLYSMPAVLYLTEWPFVASGIGVVAVTIVLLWRRRAWPAVLSAWTFYVIAVLPVSGLLQNGPQIAADRYTYFPMLGFALLAGGGIAQLTLAWRAGRLAPSHALVVAGAGTALVVTLVGVTWYQITVWRDNEALWSHAHHVAPSSSSAAALAQVRLEQGRYEDAMALARQSIRLNPAAPAGYNMAGLIFQELKQPERALVQFRKALEMSPNDLPARTNLGVTFYDLERWNEALDEFDRAFKLAPNDPKVRENLVAVLIRLGLAPGNAGPVKAIFRPW